MTWIKSRGSRDKTRSNTAVAIFQSSLILLICLDVEINVMDMGYCVAKVKHRHRFCSATHRIQLRKWLASVKMADSSSSSTAGRPACCYSPTDSDSGSASASGSGPLPLALALTLSLTLRLSVSSTTTVRLRFTCDEFNRI